MEPQQRGYGYSADGGLPRLNAKQQSCQMATAFYELCNQAHESNIRRGLHSASSPSDHDDSYSVASSDTKANPRSRGEMPTKDLQKNVKDVQKSLNSSSRPKIEYPDKDVDGDDMYGSDSIEANMSRKRKSSERYAHYQDLSSGNHFGNLGPELQTLQRQLSLKQATSDRTLN